VQERERVITMEIHTNSDHNFGDARTG